jgi:hypothetical protein
LPAALRNVIVQKHILISTRQSIVAVLTDDNSILRLDIGNLWVPSEVELFGSVIFGTPGRSAAGFVQYPIFESNVTKRIKRMVNGDIAVSWWLCVPQSGSSANIAHALVNGSPGQINASTSNICTVPICFRIA